MVLGGTGDLGWRDERFHALPREISMPPKLRSSLRLIACATLTLLVAAGCGGGTAAVASVTPSPTVAVTPSPTPSPTPRPTPTKAPLPTPTAVPSPGFIDTLKIGSPYELVYNPSNQALSGSFDFNMGSVTVTETLSGREIHERTKLVGLAYVLEFDGFPMNDAAFEGGARGAAATSGGKLTYAKVLGHRVAYVVAKAASFAMYRDHDVIVMVGAESLSLTKTLLASVIKANP
jgi:hypothetical protein